MQFIEISNENGDILYRGTNVRNDDKNYIFVDILTDSEIIVPKKDAYCVSNLTYAGYENTLKYLTLIKNDDQLTKAEKKQLFKLQRVYSRYINLKCLKALNITKYNVLDDVPLKIFQKSLVDLINIELKKATSILDELISAENDETVILEINSTKSDLENNVKDFIANELSKIDLQNFMQKWPTLLNPSPFQQLLNN
jgi:hypothetical protein